MIPPEIVAELKSANAKRIFVQFPEGLTLKIQEIAKELEKEGFEAVLCMNTVFGACDTREDESKRLKCDTILQIAHADFGIKASMPVVYWDYLIDVDPLPILEKDFSKLDGFENIGLITQLQYVKTLVSVKKFLESKGKKVFIGKSKTEKYDGQVLGCRLDAGKMIESKVDCFLCISSGKFYVQGMFLATSKPVFNLNMEYGRIEPTDQLRKKLMKIIAWNRAQFKDARNVGILVTWKLGQMKLPYALKEKIEKMGKRAFILAMDEIVPEKLEGLKLDFLVSTGCPRIGTDDIGRYKIPIVNAAELQEMFAD
jgi:2-(3-amino-3-carboxypropyl)histidine synthase